MDARFPTHYLNDRRVMRLSPDQFRVYVLATAWAVTNRTDGRIERDELILVPFGTADIADALVKAGLWAVTSLGWQIVDYAETQTSKAQLEGLEARRRNDADRQARKRLRDHRVPEFATEDHVSLSRDDKGKERQGKARTGKDDEALPANDETESVDQQTGEVIPAGLSWPTVEIPKSDPGYCSGCGSALPCSKKHSRIELARLAS